MKIVVLLEDGFPFLDTSPLSAELLHAALNRYPDMQFVTAAELPAALDAQPAVFINPYGSAFPKPAWIPFIQYLRQGGNWVNLGGAPLTRPVRWEDGQWRAECEQTQYGKALRINHAFEIALPPDHTLRSPRPEADLDTHFHAFRPKRAWSLQVRFTTTKDSPREQGSAGPREAVLHPLVWADHEGRTVAAPVIAIDRLLGEFAGGRWVLACCEGDSALPADLIAGIVDYAVRPRADLHVQPSFACYYPGEMACLNVRVSTCTPSELRVNLRVYSRANHREIYAHTYRTTTGEAPAYIQTSPFPAPDPGLYIVRANVEAERRSKPIASVETGFWVYDRELISSGAPITHDGDYFQRAGKPYPVTGTTYMAGDAHRKFLFEPNPAVWDADFAAMAAAGVNMVRTGFWTGWKRAMMDPGAVDEGVLRALAAFLLTARRYNIPVIFNLFAFWPEEWGGVNPYLDPQAVSAQRAFVSAFARRFAHVNDLLWDLINEPSFCSPERVWSTRPNHDQFEREAWRTWLAKQAVSDDEWRERWRLTPEDPLDLPALEDFEDPYIFQDRHPLRVRDYHLFAQEMFAEWAAQMVATIRENGNPKQLVTVGQDEGGTRDRPNPWFHSHVVDFTSNHSWWQNDDLLWDSVITKTPGKPNLIEETGIMFVEGLDGRAWRTPEECRNLLERKMALAFAAGCAGFIQWLWNTNVYMDSDNEVGIGFLRADGSEKPELEAFRGVARFFRENSHRMTGRKPEEAVVVIPHSNMFSVRDTATQATRRAVRALEYGLGIPCRAVAENRAEEAAGAKLIVLPSARVLTESAWQKLLSLVEAGATLLVSGYIESDEYCRRIDRVAQLLGYEIRRRPVTQKDAFTTSVDLRSGREAHKEFHLSFTGDCIQRLEAGECTGQPAGLLRGIHHGDGCVCYTPVPVELEEGYYAYVASDEVASLAFGKPTFNLKKHHAPGLLIRRVEYTEGTLLIIVNESGVQVPRPSPWPDKVKSLDRIPFDMELPAGRIALAFAATASDEAAARYDVGDQPTAATGD